MEVLFWPRGIEVGGERASSIVQPILYYKTTLFKFHDGNYKTLLGSKANGSNPVV